jgi:uncharacterized protein DUF6580
VQRAAIETIVFLLLVAAGAASRVFFRDVPNFAPIAAMALFAGYFFRRAWLAPVLPLLALAISDPFIGFYDWKLMVVVYSMLTLPAALGPLTRHFLAIERRQISTTVRSLVGLVTCSLGCSLSFFLVTNFACWYGSEWYPQNWQGLTTCFAAALPFFKYTLLGDLFYASALFGGYALAINLKWLSAAETKLAELPVEA